VQKAVSKDVLIAFVKTLNVLTVSVYSYRAGVGNCWEETVRRKR